MADAAPSARQLDSFAFACTVALIGFLICAMADGFDGVTSTRHHHYTLADDPRAFKAALMLRWGYPAILAAIGAVASGLGALAAKTAQKISTDQ